MTWTANRFADCGLNDLAAQRNIDRDPRQSSNCLASAGYTGPSISLNDVSGAHFRFLIELSVWRQEINALILA
jgi:hypothetical protein